MFSHIKTGHMYLQSHTFRFSKKKCQEKIHFIILHLSPMPYIILTDFICLKGIEFITMDSLATFTVTSSKEVIFNIKGTGTDNEILRY